MRVDLANPWMQVLAWVTCLSCAYLLTLPIYRGLTAMDAALARLRQPPSAENFLVAKRVLPVGHMVTPLDLDWGRIPGFFPVGGLRDVDEILGRSVQERILAGDALREERFSPFDGKGLAALVPPGHRAVTIQLTDSDRVSGFVEPGDHVDLLITIFEAPRRAMTMPVLENVRVLALDDQLGAAPLGTSAPKAQVTLLTTPVKASHLAHALQMGFPRLVLRPQQDEGADPVGPPWVPPEEEAPAPLEDEEAAEVQTRREAVAAFRQWVERWPLTADQRSLVRDALARAERDAR